VGYEESRGANEHLGGFATLKPADGQYTRWCGFCRRERFPQGRLDWIADDPWLAVAEPAFADEIAARRLDGLVTRSAL
jgi:hypothetical protein